MIAPSDQADCEGVPELEERTPDALAIARYGRVPQVARFNVFGPAMQRGDSIVVTTERGQELAAVLQIVKPGSSGSAPGEGITGDVLRVASEADLATAAAQEQKAESGFPDWQTRAVGWKLQLELIDVEVTLDERLILYVLNDRGAETTRLALLAAAAGFGVIHVQPVSAEGIVQSSGGGGCGSCSNHAH
jgi:cell fate regulator YaaT (PSP1 superfamily)